jgi:hypothetical protein
MKMCTIQDSPKVHLLLSDLLLLEILNKRDVFDKMVKLTNMLVEPGAKNSSILSKLQHKQEPRSYSSELCVICLYSLLLC